MLSIAHTNAQTWNGGGADNKWSTGGPPGGNWGGAPAPLNLGTANVVFAGNTRLTPDMDNNWNINSLVFNGGSGAFTLGSTGNFTLTIQGSGITNNSTSTETVTNAVTLGAAQTWSAASGNLSFSGNIANGGNLLTISGNSNTSVSSVISGTGGLTKSGTGTLTLSGANTYSGATTINAGTVAVNSSSSLGASGVAATINAGTLEATATYSSSRNFTLGDAASTIMVDPAQTFTIGNVISGTGGLTKSGTGTLTLTGANAYTGATTVSAGVVNIQNATGLGTTAAGTTVSSGAALEIQGSIAVGAEALTINGTGISSNGALRNVSGNNSWSGNITLNSDSSIGSDAGNLTISGIISAGHKLTKVGAGTLTLTGANTYTGGTIVSAGVLNIQNNTGTGTPGGGVTVSSGAALQIQGGIAVGTENLTLNGGGVASDGALRNISGNNSWAGNLTLGSDSTIASDSGTLTLTGSINNGGNLLTVTGAGDVAASGVINGAGGLTKSGAGTLTLNGTANNGYSGLTTVTDGTLLLNMTTGKNAFAGSLTVGDGVGAANSAVTRWLATNEIPGVAVSVNSDGLLDLNNFSENAISTLTMTSGSVTTGTGTLTLGGNVTGNASSTTASISGNLSLGSADRTFTIASGSTPSGTDMNISAVISGAHNITKAGAGNLVLSGANTYTGTTTVNGGTLTAAASSGSALGTTTSITVNSGATLALGASNQINDTATLTLSGGTFSKGNFAEGTASSSGIGTLILTGASSHIDFGTGTVGILSFASFTPNSNTLTIDNWTGSPSTVGNASTDRLIFNADETSNLSFFLFTGYGAGAATEISLGGGFFEVVPLVPEINPRLIIPLFCALIIALGRSRQRS